MVDITKLDRSNSAQKQALNIKLPTSNLMTAAGNKRYETDSLSALGAIGDKLVNAGFSIYMEHKFNEGREEAAKAVQESYKTGEYPERNGSFLLDPTERGRNAALDDQAEAFYLTRV